MPAFGRSAVNLLAIPTIHRSIAAVIDYDRCGSQWAKLALLWMDAKEITEADSGSPRELVQTAVTRWMDRLVGDLRHLNRYAITVESDLSAPGLYRSELEVEPASRWMYVLWCSEELSCFTLEGRIESLEKAHAGLGKTALLMFEAIAGTFSIMTPYRARICAERVWWYWQGTQEDFVEELRAYCDDEEPAEEAFAHGPDWFDSQYPEWMFGEGRQKVTQLSPEDLGQIAQASEDEEARKVAALLLELKAAMAKPMHFPYVGQDSPVEEEAAYSLAYLRWSMDDPQAGLDDDYLHEANQCGDGYTDVFGADAVPFDQSGFSEWKSSIESGFAVLRILDGLLELIADPY